MKDLKINPWYMFAIGIVVGMTTLTLINQMGEKKARARLIEQVAKEAKRLLSQSEQATERHHIAYQFSQQICESSMEIFLKGMTDEKKFGKVGPMGAKIVRKILAVEGVMGIFIDPHEIRVFKSEPFEWEPIDSQIKKIIQ